MPLQNGDRGVFLKPCSTHWPQKRPHQHLQPQPRWWYTRAWAEWCHQHLKECHQHWRWHTRWQVAYSAGTGPLQKQMLFVLKGDGRLCDSSIRRLGRATWKIHQGKKVLQKKNIFLIDVFVKILIWWKMLPIQIWKTTLTEHRQVLKNTKDKKRAELWKFPVRPDNCGRGIENGSNLTRQRCQRCCLIPTSMSCQQHHYWIIKAD